MKSCAACNYENEDDAEFCARCGAHLTEAKAKPHISTKKKDDDCYGSEEQECFGLPYGGAICGIIFGVIIILWAAGLLLGWNVWDYFWPLIFVIIGGLIVAGAIYSMRHRS
ncbi:MAG: zinc-ribbon domain-containing protein [Candidatus Thorarchaeota archaeon]